MNRLQRQTLAWLRKHGYQLALNEVDKNGDRTYIAPSITPSIKSHLSNLIEFRITPWGQYTGHRLSVYTGHHSQ